MLQPSSFKAPGVVEPLDSNDTPGLTTPRTQSLQSPSDPDDARVEGLDHFAFPEPDYPPTFRFERQRLPPVPLDVLTELLRPERNRGTRRGIVLWTPVPEAPIDEHRDPVSPHEDDVWPDAQT